MVNKSVFTVKGIKTLREIIDDPIRQYGVKVHCHLPQKSVEIEAFGYEKNVIRLPEQERLIRELAEYFGVMPTKRTLPDTYAATIEDSYVFGNSGMIVTPDGYVILETASMTGENDGRCYTVQNLLHPSFNASSSGHVKGKMLYLANPGGGYSHHLLESYASMFWFYGHSFERICAAKGKNAECLADFFEAMNLEADIILGLSKYEIISADFVSFFAPCSTTLLRKETVDLVQTLLVKNNRVRLPATKKIFCEAGAKTVGAHRRVTSNYLEMREFLQSEGFDFIDLAQFNIIEKIRYLSQVDTAVTMYGSAAANLFLLASKEIKWISIAQANNMMANSIVGNFPVPGYTSWETIPKLRKLQENNGNLMTGNSVLWCRNAVIDRLPSAVFYSSMPSKFIGNFCTEVDIDKFVQFYKLYALRN